MTTQLGIPRVLAAVAIIPEVAAPVALLAGFGTRIAAFGRAVFMVVAAATHPGNGFFMNWSGAMPSEKEGVEYHILAIALVVLVVLAGGRSTLPAPPAEGVLRFMRDRA
jgi:putative oxidoreductase